MTSQRKPVLIVGAGPVGLLIANGLAANNVPFDIVDKKTGPSSESKGLAINISSQSAFKLCGVNDPIGNSGCKIKRLDIHWNRHRFSSINFSHLSTARNYLITQPQWVTEQELINSLKIHVRWSHELIGLQQESSGVVAHLQTEEGEVSEQYEYVVGCDGKYSKVRSYISRDEEFTQYDMHFVLGDFQLEQQVPRDTVQYQVFSDAFFILVPISNELTRVVVKYDGPPPDRPVQSADIVDYVNKYTETPLIKHNSNWISRAPFYNAVSSRMQSGRLFIAGDAAHLFSPIGGTGMNTGFQDAINLLWRLTYLYRGYASRALLNFYEEERVPANRSGMITADINTKNIADVSKAKEFIDAIAPVISNRSNLRFNLPAAISGYTYTLGSIGGHPDRVGHYDSALCDYILEHKPNQKEPHQFKHSLLINESDINRETSNRVVEQCLSYGFIDVLIIEADEKSIIKQHLQDTYTLLRPDGVIELECCHLDHNFIFDYLNVNYKANIDSAIEDKQSENGLLAL
ncbi:hypothetical protein A9Q81_09880 [Gammaproteobacteria bacterium 42_54_T18]|nr:hypothetical protein A9Q81_09880 [Gammaproteobacteria bacterium 42_54_T18]